MKFNEITCISGIIFDTNINNFMILTKFYSKSFFLINKAKHSYFFGRKPKIQTLKRLKKVQEKLRRRYPNLHININLNLRPKYFLAICKEDHYAYHLDFNSVKSLESFIKLYRERDTLIELESMNKK